MPLGTSTEFQVLYQFRCEQNLTLTDKCTWRTVLLHMLWFRIPTINCPSPISPQIFLSFHTILRSRNPLKSSLRERSEVTLSAKMKFNKMFLPPSSCIHLRALHGWRDLTTPHSRMHCASLTCLVFTCNRIPPSDAGLPSSFSSLGGEDANYD